MACIPKLSTQDSALLMDRQITFRITLTAPPLGVDFGLQEGKGSNYETVQKQRSAGKDLHFEFTAGLKPGGKSNEPALSGPFVQGPTGGKFVYLDIGTYAGQLDTCWSRRLKIPLYGITTDLLSESSDESDLVLETRVPGTGRDGGPNCATVKPFEGWRMACAQGSGKSARGSSDRDARLTKRRAANKSSVARKNNESSARATAAKGARVAASKGARAGARKGSGCDWSTVQQIARGLPEAVEGLSYGTAAFHVRKKLFVRMHQGRESVVVMIPIEVREGLMQSDPETFYITDHYLGYPAMLVRLRTVRFEDLRSLVEESWRSQAPLKLLVEYDSK